MEKQIKITPSLFSLKKTKKSNGKKNNEKGKSKKNINTFLNRIKEHAKNKTAKNKLTNNTSYEELDINSHIDYLEQLKQGINQTYKTVLDNIIMRDSLDTKRVNSPLKKAVDAIEIDVSNMTLDDVYEKLLTHIKNIK